MKKARIIVNKIGAVFNFVTASLGGIKLCLGLLMVILGILTFVGFCSTCHWSSDVMAHYFSNLTESQFTPVIHLQLTFVFIFVGVNKLLEGLIFFVSNIIQGLITMRYEKDEAKRKANAIASIVLSVIFTFNFISLAGAILVLVTKKDKLQK